MTIIRSQRIRRRTPSSNDNESSSPDATSKTILATSTTLQESQQTILQKLQQWIELWCNRISRFILVTTRTTEVLLLSSPLLILTPAAIISVNIFKTYIVSDMAWSYTIKAIQIMGPVAIKFFQWAATRRDIFPPNLCDHFSVLHDRGYPHSFQWTDKVLTEAFGNYKEEGLILEEVIGVGSAAQVYRGFLFTKDKNNKSNKNDSCKEVAIKVLHPRFQESVDRDLLFIEIVAEFLDSLPLEHVKMLNLPRAVEEFSVVLKDQADLTIEADNLRKFRKNFYKESKEREQQSSIVFPQPIDGWTSSKVIVEDYVHESAPISDFLFDSSVEGMKVRKELAGPLLRAFLKMVFMDNFIHGDLHPVRIFYGVQLLLFF